MCQYAIVGQIHYHVAARSRYVLDVSVSRRGRDRQRIVTRRNIDTEAPVVVCDSDRFFFSRFHISESYSRAIGRHLRGYIEHSNEGVDVGGHARR